MNTVGDDGGTAEQGESCRSHLSGKALVSPRHAHMRLPSLYEPLLPSGARMVFHLNTRENQDLYAALTIFARSMALPLGKLMGS
jgi:hypothetical protein